MTLREEVDEFQDTILRIVEGYLGPYKIQIRGVEFVLFEDVFNPLVAKPSLFLSENLGVKEGDVVLDPFSGCGIDSVFAVKQGASYAVAIDKFENPYLCTRYNVRRLGLKDKIDIREGDLFSVLKPGETFDLVVANPPFRNMVAESEAAGAIRDKEYQTLRRFFREVGDYLKPKGRIRMVFSDVGDMDLLQKLAQDNGFKSETVASTKYASNVRIEVYEITKA